MIIKKVAAKAQRLLRNKVSLLDCEAAVRDTYHRDIDKWAAAAARLAWLRNNNTASWGPEVHYHLMG